MTSTAPAGGTPFPGPSTGSSSGLPTAAATAVGLAKTYGRGPAAVHALRGVDVSFSRGAFTAIMGPSGSGKSTLLHLLAGLDTATAGRVLLGDTDLTSLSDTQLTLLRRQRLGFVFQQFNLLPVLTAEQNITLPLELGGTTVDREWMGDLVDVLGLRERLTHRPAELSGGQQQRVAIARALITKPELVLADEPTGNLDSRSGAEVLEFLRRSVRELGRTVVMVTHDAVAASYADRVVLLADGALAGEVTDPTPEAVTSALDALRTSLPVAGVTTGSIPVVRASSGPLGGPNSGSAGGNGR
ncbi:putative ABC transport system ATP-binding protein [Quadrisphaera granulorum]|uniref:Putative ABC transport system ATP-binding protein n=1 Tax=Quadrisphaera granulorum TaxID=317664 RepID=A0A316A7G2_9ACTN|nr:ABC transporter ATP-binding protein [Quadrisphaera granulorum]PWJ53148.1 putative ABC transport system ATP-binding protein [Quadrisphaera granulorum]SZE97080.1 putative ABC transport system ATP-binding protein [Quadrisphaera granulorum]